MILLLLGFVGVAGLAAVAESLPLDAEPRPMLWLAVALIFPFATLALEAPLGRRWTRRMRWMLFVSAYASILYPLGWAGWTLDHLGWRGRPLPSLVLLFAPAAALIVWASPWLYRRDMRVTSQDALERMPSYGRWLMDSARIVLVPLWILLAVSWAAGWITDAGLLDVASRSLRSADIVFGAAALLGLLAVSPLLVLLAWRTEAFPDGALRDRLEEIAQRLGVKVRSIRVWDARTRYIVNACAVGIVPGTRAVIFTRGIRELLSDEEISAVFAHEAAHLARGHLLLYAAMGLSFLLSLSPLEPALEAVPAWIAWSTLGVYVCLFWVLGLGVISRRLETEADLTAANVAGTGAYSSALRKAACLIGPAARRNGWRHLSLDRRLEILEAAASDPGHARRVLGSCRRLRAGLVLFLVVSMIGFAWNIAREPVRLANAARSIRGAFALIEEAEAMRPLLEHVAARRSESSGIARWLGRNREAIESDYRSIVDAARRAVEQAERTAPGESVELRARLEALR